MELEGINMTPVPQLVVFSSSHIITSFQSQFSQASFSKKALASNSKDVQSRNRHRDSPESLDGRSSQRSSRRSCIYGGHQSRKTMDSHTYLPIKPPSIEATSNKTTFRSLYTRTWSTTEIPRSSARPVSATHSRKTLRGKQFTCTKLILAKAKKRFHNISSMNIRPGYICDAYMGFACNQMLKAGMQGEHRNLENENVSNMIESMKCRPNQVGLEGS